MKKIMLSAVFSVLAVLLVLSPSAEAGSTGYNGGFYFESDDGAYTLKTNVIFQGLYQYNMLTNGADDTHTLRVRRSRLKFGGNALTEDLRYAFQAEFAGAAGGATASLLDAYFDYKVMDEFQIRFGQFRTPFDIELLTSSSKQQFVDRSIVFNAMSFGRQIGLDFHGKFLDGVVGYNLFVVNGDGRNVNNANGEIVAGLRIEWDIMGDHGYGQSDTGDSEEPHFMFGVGGAYDFGNAALTADDHLIYVTADLSFKYVGFSFVGAGNYIRNTTDSNNDFGLLAQAGYFFIPEKFELAARFASAIRRSGGALEAGSVNTFEYTGGLNYFFSGHPIKFQLDYSYLLNNGLVQNQDDHRLRAQVQLIF